MEQRKKENAPAATGAPSENADYIINNDIVTQNFRDVNLSEFLQRTGAQNKDIAEVIQQYYPNFSRQILSQCAYPEKYGIVLLPQVIGIIQREYHISPPKRKSADQPRDRSVNHLSQKDRILRHIRDYGSITSLEAMTEYGIMRLASRISDLKGAGYDIVSITETSKNRYGEPTSYSRYYLLGG